MTKFLGLRVEMLNELEKSIKKSYAWVKLKDHGPWVFENYELCNE